MFVFSETMDPITNNDSEYDPILMCKTVAVPPKWTSWMTIDVHGPCTLQGMIDQCKEKHDLILSFIILGTKSIWMQGNKSQVERYF